MSKVQIPTFKMSGIQYESYMASLASDSEVLWPPNIQLLDSNRQYESYMASLAVDADVSWAPEGQRLDRGIARTNSSANNVHLITDIRHPDGGSVDVPHTQSPIQENSPLNSLEALVLSGQPKEFVCPRNAIPPKAEEERVKQSSNLPQFETVPSAAGYVDPVIHKQQAYPSVEERLKTFYNWPHTKPSARKMAEAGFVFLGPTHIKQRCKTFSVNDMVRCVKCGRTMYMFEEDDDPAEEHERLYDPRDPVLYKTYRVSDIKQHRTAHLN